MGFLRKLLGKDEPGATEITVSVTQPPISPGPVPAPDPTTERRYANTACPTCGAEQDPLPKAKKKCRACGNPMWVRTAPDGLTYLLAENDLAAHQNRWDEKWDEKDRQAIVEHQAVAAEACARQIADAIEYGGRLRFLAMDDSCLRCKALSGRVFDPRSVPKFPVQGCSNEICRCDYSPVTIFDTRLPTRE